jgi:hypothetical protein
LRGKSRDKAVTNDGIMTVLSTLKVKENGMGGAYSTQKEMRKAYKFFILYLKGRNS